MSVLTGTENVDSDIQTVVGRQPDVVSSLEIVQHAVIGIRKRRDFCCRVTFGILVVFQSQRHPVTRHVGPTAIQLNPLGQRVGKRQREFVPVVILRRETSPPIQFRKEAVAPKQAITKVPRQFAPTALRLKVHAVRTPLTTCQLVAPARIGRQVLIAVAVSNRLRIHL